MYHISVFYVLWKCSRDLGGDSFLWGAEQILVSFCKQRYVSSCQMMFLLPCGCCILLNFLKSAPPNPLSLARAVCLVSRLVVLLATLPQLIWWKRKGILTAKPSIPHVPQQHILGWKSSLYPWVIALPWILSIRYTNFTHFRFCWVWSYLGLYICKFAKKHFGGTFWDFTVKGEGEGSSVFKKSGSIVPIFGDDQWQARS